MIKMGGGGRSLYFGTRWRGAFGTFVITRPTLSCSHWLDFVYTECCHDIIYMPAMRPFNDTTSFCQLLLKTKLRK